MMTRIRDPSLSLLLSESLSGTRPARPVTRPAAVSRRARPGRRVGPAGPPVRDTRKLSDFPVMNVKPCL